MVSRAAVFAVPVMGLWRLSLRVHAHSSYQLMVNGLLLPGVISLWAQAHSDGGDFTRHVVVGTVVLGVCTLASRRGGMTVARERAHGMWDLLATSSVTREVYMATQLLDIVALCAIPMLGVPIALWLFAVDLPASPLWVLPCVLCALILGVVGLLAGSRLPRQLSGTFVTLLNVVTVALCPLVYTVDRVPQHLWPLVRVLPPTLATELAEQAWQGHGMPLPELTLLVVWTVVGLAALLWGFRWHGAR